MSFTHFPPSDPVGGKRLRAATVAWAPLLGALHAVGFRPYLELHRGEREDPLRLYCELEGDLLLDLSIEDEEIQSWTFCSIGSQSPHVGPGGASEEQPRGRPGVTPPDSPIAITSGMEGSTLVSIGSYGFEPRFGQVLRLCDEAGLVRPGVVAVDGTRLAGNASPEANRVDHLVPVPMNPRCVQPASTTGIVST